MWRKIKGTCAKTDLMCLMERINSSDFNMAMVCGFYLIYEGYVQRVTPKPALQITKPNLKMETRASLHHNERESEWKNNQIVTLNFDHQLCMEMRWMDFKTSQHNVCAWLPPAQRDKKKNNPFLQWHKNKCINCIYTELWRSSVSRCLTRQVPWLAEIVLACGRSWKIVVHLASLDVVGQLCDCAEGIQRSLLLRPGNRNKTLKRSASKNGPNVFLITISLESSSPTAIAVMGLKMHSIIQMGPKNSDNPLLTWIMHEAQDK